METAVRHGSWGAGLGAGAGTRSPSSASMPPTTPLLTRVQDGTQPAGSTRLRPGPAPSPPSGPEEGLLKASPPLRFPEPMASTSGPLSLLGRWTKRKVNERQGVW